MGWKSAIARRFRGLGIIYAKAFLFLNLDFGGVGRCQAYLCEDRLNGLVAYGK
jgi:hypothetical protein